MSLKADSKSLAATAERIRGKVSDVRSVLDLNPDKLPFEMPPAVETGLQLLEDLGVKVPSLQQVTDRIRGELADELTAADKVLKNADQALGSIGGILSSIEWLL
jgi:hypothetical protein